MEKRELVFNTLKITGCLTAKEIQNSILRKHQVNISPQTISSILRPYIQRGYVGLSPNTKNQKVYWLVKSEWNDKLLQGFN